MSLITSLVVILASAGYGSAMFKTCSSAYMRNEDCPKWHYCEESNGWCRPCFVCDGIPRSPRGNCKAPVACTHGEYNIVCPPLHERYPSTMLTQDEYSYLGTEAAANCTDEDGNFRVDKLACGVILQKDNTTGEKFYEPTWKGNMSCVILEPVAQPLLPTVPNDHLDVTLSVVAAVVVLVILLVVVLGYRNWQKISKNKSDQQSLSCEIKVPRQAEEAVSEFPESGIVPNHETSASHAPITSAPITSEPPQHEFNITETDKLLPTTRHANVDSERISANNTPVKSTSTSSNPVQTDRPSTVLQQDGYLDDKSSIQFTSNKYNTRRLSRSPNQCSWDSCSMENCSEPQSNLDSETGAKIPHVHPQPTEHVWDSSDSSCLQSSIQNSQNSEPSELLAPHQSNDYTCQSVSSEHSDHQTRTFQTPIIHLIGPLSATTGHQLRREPREHSNIPSGTSSAAGSFGLLTTCSTDESDRPATSASTFSSSGCIRGTTSPESEDSNNQLTPGSGDSGI